MSNFADLIRADQFQGQPTTSTNRLKRHVFFGGASLFALILGAGLVAWLARPASSSVAPPPPVPVMAERVEPHTVTPFADFSGRINAVDYAEIRPQVGGRITEIRFHDGQRVKAGDVLFVIDPRPYEAAAAKARSDLASAVNNARESQLERARGERLIAAHALAQESFDQRINADNVAEAAVGAAQALLKQAELNVDYAYVKAPISGRISRAEITVGNLVGSTTAPPPLLASIVSDDGVYADFEVDEATYLNSIRQLPEQKI
ncbi:MAG TPA: efflux RND transporter periplasmic adaptor subunit, partial [Rhizomicrobium sp.]|nr:efflux RND transporter periplasmic adaptor subunit [Rhizomicrobium sp.]